MNFKDYNHCIPVQVRFNDVDRLNHVNNACYLTYFELGRVRYFKDVFKENINWEEKGFILARTEIDHLQPVFLNDDIYCFTKVTRVGTKSITVKNSIVKKNGNALLECAVGTGVLVATDYLSRESIELPPIWVRLIEHFEGDLKKEVEK